MKDMNPKICIVEDDHFYAELIRTTLTNEGHQDVTHYSTGQDCLQNLNLGPDIIILDHTLGSMSGIHVLKEIKRTSPNVQVIFLSGQEEMSIAINALKLGALDYIEKTHKSSMVRLLVMIEKAKEARQQLADNHRLNAIKKWFLMQ